MQHGARQYGKTFALAAVLDIIKRDLSGDRIAAAEAGALGADRIAERAATMFREKILARGSVDKVLEETRFDVAELPEAWASTTASRLQAELARDLERDVRARRQLEAAVRPVTPEFVNRIELDVSIRQADAALDAVCAAMAGDETPLAAPHRIRGRMVSDKAAVAKWDLHAQQRGEKLFRALSDLGVPASALPGAIEIRPAWLPGGLSVGDAVTDHRLEPLLHPCLPTLVQRLTA